MKRWKTGLAGALACVLLSGCCIEASNSTEDEEESDSNTNTSSPITRNVEFMTLYNCNQYVQAAVFWKERFADDSTALKHTFAPSGINPINCPTQYQTTRTINFAPGTTYDVWVVRIAPANCFQGGDQANDIDPRDTGCFVTDRFIVNGTANNKTTEVRMD